MPYTTVKKPSLVSRLLNGVSDIIHVFNPQAWDGWPDGDMEFDLTEAEYIASKQLVTHWACSSSGGQRGNKLADNWEHGKRQLRECLGYISCLNEACQHSIRPAVRNKEARRLQLVEPCPLCKSELQLHPCPARATIHTWKGGRHYQHRALSLVVGAPGRESVAKISELLMNTDRVRKEQEKVRKKMNISASDDFMVDFAAFEEEYESVIKQKSMGRIGMISLQSPFMAKLPLMDYTPARDFESDAAAGTPTARFPVDGIISDAAHGYWKDQKAILIISSSYSSCLLCWVPILISYALGQSAEYYELHFLAMMESIAADADERGLEFTDEMVAGVCDYSIFWTFTYRGADCRFQSGSVIWFYRCLC
ncbi:hypothetical protein C8J56DRAFT_785676 [Mycena floridula]|nr:hypothetical protein C8J56DRAFT_785676 [Mycena floridula]